MRDVVITMNDIKVKCGKCKGYHPSARHVKECYQLTPSTSHLRKQTTPEYAKANQRSLGVETKASVTARVGKARPAGMATDNQIGYICDLLAQVTDGAASVKGLSSALTTARDEGKLTFAIAWNTIDKLKVEIASKKAEQAAPAARVIEANKIPLVPSGRYAIEREGTLKFYKVDRPTEGRWAGKTFVSVQASDELHSVRSYTERRAILVEIAKDSQAAMERYGRELGRCGHCGRTLTNEESRARGIGPVCAQRMGW